MVRTRSKKDIPRQNKATSTPPLSPTFCFFQEHFQKSVSLESCSFSSTDLFQSSRVILTTLWAAGFNGSEEVPSSYVFFAAVLLECVWPSAYDFALSCLWNGDSADSWIKTANAQQILCILLYGNVFPLVLQRAFYKYQQHFSKIKYSF